MTNDSLPAGDGTSSKTLLTEAGAVDLDVPRDRSGSFEPRNPALDYENVHKHLIRQGIL